MLIALLQIIIVFAGSLLFFLFVKLAYRFLRADSLRYRQLHAVGTFKDAINGTISRDELPAYLIREGLAIDKKGGGIVPQGTLSDDALNSLLQ